MAPRTPGKHALIFVAVTVVAPRLGERRAALTGIAIAGVGYVGYASATASWMMFAWLFTWLFGAIVMPTTHALTSHRVPSDAQGELQGAVASLHSLSSIVGPPLMAQLFGRFSAAGAALHAPGAAFVAAGVITAACFLLYRAASAAPATVPAAAPESA
jgi:DHA1 family tetracycline resistance protein-like MFS transporter